MYTNKPMMPPVPQAIWGSREGVEEASCERLHLCVQHNPGEGRPIPWVGDCTLVVVEEVEE